MGKYKICVYAICKNEENYVEQWMDSMSEADLVVVVDTGSTDSTVKLLRDRGAIVYCEKIVPWRFDVARNLALAYIPNDIDICVSTDLDEILVMGWRGILENTWDDFVTRGHFIYNYLLNEDGTPNKQFTREKIHSRFDYTWVNPVHEVLKYIGPNQEVATFLTGVILNHYPDFTKSRSQYLPLLELSAQESPNDDRTVFWLGREYMYYGKYDECIETLKKHLELPSAIWDEERAASMRCIANSYKEKGDIQEAKNWLYRSIAECSNVREPYLDMAKIGYEQQDWLLVYFMTTLGLNIKQSTGSYLVDLDCWSFWFEDYAALACYYLGLYQEAVDHGRKACEIEPKDERLKKNLTYYESKLRDDGGNE